jgi:hypothetical protein
MREATYSMFVLEFVCDFICKAFNGSCCRAAVCIIMTVWDDVCVVSVHCALKAVVSVHGFGLGAAAEM